MPIKSLIDDYYLIAYGLSNNLQDDSEYLVVAEFQGDNLEELMTNVKTKKHIGVEDNGGVKFKTIDIPYEARKTKLELDEKNIFRLGIGLKTEGLKDTETTTNIAIKSAYSLLNLRCNKLEIRLKQFLRKILEIVIKESNEKNGTDYKSKDVYTGLERETQANEVENAQVEVSLAQKRQVEISTSLNLQSTLDDKTLVKLICEQLDIDYEENKSKLPKNKEKGTDILKQWDDTLDKKTRKAHRLLDGQIRELDEPFEINGYKSMYPSNFGIPSLDINCRCAVLDEL